MPCQARTSNSCSGSSKHKRQAAIQSVGIRAHNRGQRHSRAAQESLSRSNDLKVLNLQGKGGFPCTKSLDRLLVHALNLITLLFTTGVCRYLWLAVRPLSLHLGCPAQCPDASEEVLKTNVHIHVPSRFDGRAEFWAFLVRVA